MASFADTNNALSSSTTATGGGGISTSGGGSATTGGQEIASAGGGILDGIANMLHAINDLKGTSSTTQAGQPLYKAKLCFLLDCTGSMGKEITAAKEKLTSIMAECSTKFGTKVELKVAFVGYRDIGDGPRRFEILPFTMSTAEVNDFMNPILPAGGDDEAEDVVGGLEEVLKLDWSDAKIKLLFHVGDAPGHGRDLSGGAQDSHPDGLSDQRPWQEVIVALARFHIDIYFGQVPSPMGIRTDTMLREFKRVYDGTGYQRQNYTIIPVLAGYNPNEFFTHVMASLSTSIFKQMQSTLPTDIKKAREAAKKAAK